MEIGYERNGIIKYLDGRGVCRKCGRIVDGNICLHCASQEIGE